MSYNIISLFSGAGGLDLGFKGDFTFLNNYYNKQDFNIIFACDINKEACLTYSKNFQHPPFHGDISEAISRQLIPAHADVVIGGFPCQPFSYAGSRKGLEDSRGLLYKSMLDIVDKVKPKIFIAENVKGILDIQGGAVLQAIIDDFESIGYNMNYHLYQIADYGIPQSRSRVLFVGLNRDYFKDDEFFEHPKPSVSSHIASKEALDDLIIVEEGGIPNHYWSKAKKGNGQGNTTIKAESIAPTMRAEHHGNIEFHYALPRRLSAREAARIQSFPDNFIFYPSTSAAYRQIGNAVPPVFAWHIAQKIKEYL